MAAALDDALAAMRESGGAVEFMELAQRAARRLPAVINAIEEGADAFLRHSDGVRSGISDPTATRAVFELTTAQERLESLRREKAELERIVGQALVLIQAIREDMGDGCAASVERHFIDGESWTAIAEEEGVSYRAIAYRRDSALAYLDALARCGC